jgi:hypothetical protein
MSNADPFATIRKLGQEVGASWPGYERAAQTTVQAENALRESLDALCDPSRLLGPDVSLVLFGSFARREMLEGSDFDWSLLIDGVVNNEHADLARTIDAAIRARGLKSPGTSGTFGNLVFSHDLVHRIGGGVDSNANLTRRMLMLLESRPFSLSPADDANQVWKTC